MLDSMIMTGKPYANYYVDLSFDKDATGSRILMDRGTAAVTFTRTANSAGANDGVVDDPVFGKCYLFDGNAYFVGSKALNIWNKQYRMRLKFVPNTTLSRGIIETGNYPSSGNIKAGWALSINQYTQTYFQMFMTQQNGVYARLLPTGVNPGNAVLEDYEITRIGSTITVKNMNTGQTASNQFLTNGENNIHVAGSYTGGFNNTFIGLLKSFQIELLA